MTYGRDAADAAELFLGTGPVRATLNNADPTTINRAADAVTAALRPYQQPEGVRLNGAFWLVSATAG